MDDLFGCIHALKMAVSEQISSSIFVQRLRSVAARSIVACTDWIAIFGLRLSVQLIWFSIQAFTVKGSALAVPGVMVFLKLEFFDSFWCSRAYRPPIVTL